jgi:hypothetical protein
MLLGRPQTGYAQQIAAVSGAPEISITQVPPAGAGASTHSTIKGRVRGVSAKQARVVVYALGDHWYVQPTAARPLTAIRNGGVWKTATHLGFSYAALLVRKTFVPPPVTDALPPVGGDVLASAIGDPTRHLTFSGLDWSVKASSGPVGPGPNRFSDSKRNVWVDNQGRLHLAIAPQGNGWTCAEVISSQSFGYGTYRFVLDSPTAGFDPNVVLGLFTWDDDPAENHREIDVELTRGPQPDGFNAQFVVQPFFVAGNLQRFSVPAGAAPVTHQFDWWPGAVLFRSVRGTDPNPGSPADLINAWDFYGAVPAPGGEKAHLNLWLWNGAPPTNHRRVEVIIRRFEFVPSAGC